MAAKKQGELPEDLQMKSLVPDWEQPYRVPENWVWVYWGQCGNFIAGNAFNPSMQGFGQYPIPFYKVGSLKYSDNAGYLFDLTNTVNEEMCIVMKTSLIPINSVIFAKIGEAIRLNRRSLNDVPCCIDNNLMAFSVNEVCNYKYVYFWSYTQEFYNLTNATTVPAIRKSDLETIPIPLPPLAEQRRIVERIESLFEKLDYAKEMAQSALDSFETRKAAILHKAFTGELTAKWREENGVGMESWETRPLSNCAFVQTGLAKGKKYTTQTTVCPYLRVANVQDGYLDLREIKQIEVDLNYVARYTLQFGDVLFTEGGDYDKLGRGTVWHNEIPMCLHQNHVFAVRPHLENLDSHYLAYLAGSNYGKNYFLSCSKQTTNLASINSTQLKAFPVLLPSLSEQQEIVRILDGLFKKEQRARELCDVIYKIDLMKKAILARAFRGDLGTNDPTEESALELLISCLAQ